MPAKSEKQAKFMRAVAHGWKPKGKKSKQQPSKKVARKFMKKGVHTESQKSKKESPTERALNLRKHIRTKVDSEMGKGVVMGKEVEKSVKLAGIMARIEARRLHKLEHPVTGMMNTKSQNSGNQKTATYKSQNSGESKENQNESFTTKRDAWRKGILTNVPDNKTMYFTGKQTSYDTAVLMRNAIKVKR